MSEPAGLTGHLRLRCAVRPDGTSFVAEQAFAAPLHLSKTYWDGRSLLVHVINQTAGLFGGDRLRLEVAVEGGASVVLSSPSATRFHPSGTREREIGLEQHFQVQAGGFLDVFPEITIPQAGSRTRQRTSIEVEHGGELLFLESVAPGRVASGESFAFSRFAWQTDVRLGNRLIHRERATLAPEGPSLAGLRAFTPSDYYAGLLLVSPLSERWDETFARHAVEIAEASGVVTGATKLSAGGWSVRILTADAVRLRHALAAWRSHIYQRLGRPLPDLRRY